VSVGVVLVRRWVSNSQDPVLWHLQQPTQLPQAAQASVHSLSPPPTHTHTFTPPPTPQIYKPHAEAMKSVEDGPDLF